MFMEKMKTQYASLCSLFFKVLEAIISPLIGAISDVSEDRYFLNVFFKLLFICHKLVYIHYIE